MASKRFTPEQIISKLREAEVLLAQGAKMGVVCKRIAVTEQTYYRWRKEYGGLRLDQAKRFKALEKEKARLKKLVADLSLDNQISKEASSGNFQAGLGRMEGESQTSGTAVEAGGVECAVKAAETKAAVAP